MARQNPIQFVPKQAETFAIERTENGLSKLVSGLAGAADLGTRIATNSVQQSNARNAALLKLRQLGDEQAQKLEETKLRNKIQEQAQKAEAARLGQREFDRASAEIERNEKEGVWSAVAGMTEGQLRTAQGRNLFSSPGAITMADRAIGERQANLDFPKLLASIAEDDSMLPSEHLKRFTNERELGSDEAQTAYSAALAERVATYERRAILDRVAQTKDLAIRNASDRLQFELVQGFDTLDRETMQNLLSSTYRSLALANPGLKEGEYRAFVVQSIAPLFVGNEARFSAVQGLAKLDELFSRPEMEKWGMGGLVSQLEKLAGQERAATRKSNESGINDLLDAAKTHADYRALGQQIQGMAQAGAVGPTWAAKAMGQVGAKLAEPDPEGEFEGYLAGEAIALDERHDGLIERFLDRQGLSGTQRGKTMATVFGRVTNEYLRETAALAKRADIPTYDPQARAQSFAEAMNRIEAVRQASPTLAETLVESGELPLKAALGARLAMLGEDAGLLALQMGPVSVERYDQASSLYDDPETRDEHGIKRMSKLKGGLFAADTMASRQIEQDYRAAVIAYSAGLLNARGDEANKKQLFDSAEKRAEELIRRAYAPIKIGGSKYAIRTSVIERSGWGTDGAKQNIDLLYRKWRKDMREQYPAVESIALDFDRALPVQTADGGQALRVPVIANDMLVPVAGAFSDLAFDIPIGEVALQNAAPRAKAPTPGVMNDPFRRQAGYPNFGGLD